MSRSSTRRTGRAHDSLVETQLLGRYFDAPLLKLYLRDKREAKGEVGRLDGDPLYNAQDIQISKLSISPPETARGETQVTVRFRKLGKPDPHRLRAYAFRRRVEDQRPSLR